MEKTLIFKNYSIIDSTIEYEYEYKKEIFIFKIDFINVPGEKFINANKESLHKLISYLGIALVVRLFDLDDFDTIKVNVIEIDEIEKKFFSKIFEDGLGEYRFTNNLSILHSPRLEGKNGISNNTVESVNKTDKALILNGGGKDSAVAGEIFKYINYSFDWFIVNNNNTRENMINTSGVNHIISTHIGFPKKKYLREIAKYTSHKPLGHMLAFCALINAYLLDYKYIVVSNEFSSNFGNLIINNIEINHQYTKSFEFEVLFNKFISEKVLTGIKYFSITRSLYEIQIVKIFANFPKYFPFFISCNEGVKEGYWCLQCHKCAFMFLSLSPFISYENIRIIWGENLFKNKIIREKIYELIVGDIKPFECVGVREESMLALYLCVNAKLLDEIEDIKDREKLKNLVADFNFSKINKEYLMDYNRDNNLPSEFKDKVNQFFSKYLTIT